MVSSKRISALMRWTVDRTVDVETLPTGVALDGVFFPALDPAAADHRIVLRVRGVHEHDHGILLAVLLLEVFLLYRGTPSERRHPPLLGRVRASY